MSSKLPKKKANLVIEEDSKTVREQGLDKFYTIPVIVDKCIQTIGKKYDWANWDLIVEPSAGNGSFLFKLPSVKNIGIDILPDHPDIVKQDFFTYIPNVETNILVIGNPPFGKISSLAIQFFNHAAKWASVIAFIVPRTFRRISVQNKLDMHFHLIQDEEIPTSPCSFTPPMMAKCCFQIWERRNLAREPIKLQTKHADWEFLKLGPNGLNEQPTPPIGADFALHAYGSNCGEIKKENLETLHPKSWHWIKSNIPMETLISRFEQLDYSISLNTARQNSIGKGELVSLYSDFLNTIG